MCCLFGFLNYSGTEVKDLHLFTEALAVEAGIRGTDATGIAFMQNGQLQIHKEAKSPYLWKASHPDNVPALIGHTRNTTQGDAKKNRNNHPFSGKAGGTRFALAHNGILTNEDILRKRFSLPKTNIETDSYIAVQMIEHEDSLSADTLKTMAEEVDGSFSFSVLDDRNNLYLVKGDSPRSVLRKPKKKMIAYASTEGILWRALTYSFLFDDLRNGAYEEIPVHVGDILVLHPDGTEDRSSFEYFRYQGSMGYGYPYSYGYRYDFADSDEAYLQQLRQTAEMLGIAPETVDFLLEDGFSADEIEEFIYDADCGEEAVNYGRFYPTGSDHRD